jgi:Protein-L-isoaspartate carboxylmethyltransferase
MWSIQGFPKDKFRLKYIKNKDLSSMLSKAHQNMIFGQILPNKINKAPLLHALEEINRERFVPEGHKPLAFVDTAVPLAVGRALMAPLSLARLLQVTTLKKEDKVLVVAAGTGYTPLIVSYLVDRVVALESDLALYEEMVQHLDYYNGDAITPVHGPLSQGAADYAPYDAVIIEGAIEQVPDAIVAQTKPGGQIYCFKTTCSPALQQAVVLTAQREHPSYTVKELFEAPAPVLHDLNS